MRLGILSTDPDVAVLGAGKDQAPYKYEKDQKLYSPAAASAHLIEQSGQYLISLVREGRYQPDELLIFENPLSFLLSKWLPCNNCGF